MSFSGVTPPSFTTEWDDDRIHPVIPEIDWAMAAVLGLSTRFDFSNYAHHKLFKDQGDSFNIHLKNKGF